VKMRAAILFDQPSEWEICEVELDEPRDHEVLVRVVASGLCHSDDHVAKGDGKVGRFPYCGGHEVAGVVEAVGPGVRSLAIGDHVVTSFIPGCGRCRWCAEGRQNLCDNGAMLRNGTQLDGTYRVHLPDGTAVSRSSMIPDRWRSSWAPAASASTPSRAPPTPGRAGSSSPSRSR
jgi:Zn-dependent alcohol dehydrogenase